MSTEPGPFRTIPGMSLLAVLLLAGAPVLEGLEGLEGLEARLLEERAVLETLDGSVSVRSLAELDAGDLEGAVLIRFEGFPPLGDPGFLPRDRAELELVGGDRVLGEVVDGRGDLVDVRILGGGTLSVVVDHLRSLVFPARVDPERLAGLVPASEGDRLYWIRPGGLDRVDGTLESFGTEGVTFDSVLGSKTFPWEEVAALYVEPFAEAKVAGEEGEGRPVAVDLVDGGRLRGRLRSLSAEGAEIAVTAAGSLTLPLAAIAEIVGDDGRVAFLSSLSPAEAEEGSPFDDDLGMSWPHRMDRSVSGGPLTSGGRRFGRGIGVHAPSRLTWRLDGTWRELRGAVAIDDSVLLLPHRGSVRFRVHVDGQLRWDSGIVRGGNPPVTLPPLELAGATELALEVDMATRFHVADRANWLRMLLVR